MTVRQGFYIVSLVVFVAIALIAFVWLPVLWLLVLAVPLFLVGMRDARHGVHNVLRNYPVIGHIRYFAEFIRPEIQQYFIATNQSGRPYSREIRDVIGSRAHGGDGIQPFGTQHDLLDEGTDFALHSLAPKEPKRETARVLFGGAACKQPYDASRLNISAMSYGALSKNAVIAMNKGAALDNFYQDTGEGGLTPHHLEGGGDIVWELGTGYFGCRTADGKFDPDKFREKALDERVKMVEIKVSQGAKPSHGGVLPAAKITEEISRIRGIPMGQDCISPPAHTAYSNPRGMMDFIVQLRELSDGKPVGFKLCIGRRSEFLSIVKAMMETGVTPDFIVVDGAEGGTGAAPLEFSNWLGAPLNEGLAFVHTSLVGAGLRDKLRLVASGKIATGFDMVVKTALGADTCNMARPFMFTVGCIQALRCHTNRCPTGVATQDPNRYRAIDIDTKKNRVATYHSRTIDSFLALVGAMGLDDPAQLTPAHVFQRQSDGRPWPYDRIFPGMEFGALTGRPVPESFAAEWDAASADRF